MVMLSTLTEQTSFMPAERPQLPPPAPWIASAPPLAPLEPAYGPPMPAGPRPRMRGGLPPKMLRRVREYIEAHLDEKISIESLADAIGLSMFHFARAFKQSEGVTPHDYLIRRRVKRAMELLAGTNLPLSEIAVTVGFSDQSHCARRFREIVGVCPRDYRWSTR
jgi:transcriptional regulator GlxA family with amidase domain